MTTNENRGTRQKRSENIKKEYIQKLSNDKALAEAILIGNKPCFVVVDFSDPYNNITIGIMDSLSYSEDTRLIPELLSNRPYSFGYREEFDSYVQRAKNETLDSLFNKTLALWRKYIDADDFHLKICAADTMFTYKQDVIGMTHYLFFIADNDAGKSNNLSMFNILGYRNLMSTSMTYANIYNFLGSEEEGVGTICTDEADNIDQYPELMSILKPGYTGTAEQAEAFKEEVARIGWEDKRSKVAATAEANLSGDGVMFGDKSLTLTRSLGWAKWERP